MQFNFFRFVITVLPCDLFLSKGHEVEWNSLDAEIIMI